MSGGWIKLHRSILEDPVWTTANPEQKVVLMTVLLSASHEPRQWAWEGKKFEVQPGQFVTSLSNLATKAGVSIQSVRSAIARFEKLDILTNESTKTGRLISIKKWRTYQDTADTPNKEASKDPTKTQQLSRMKEGKKEIPYSEIVSILNEATGKRFRPDTKATQSLIRARWNEGFRLEEFKAVIHGRVEAWQNKPDMAEF